MRSGVGVGPEPNRAGVGAEPEPEPDQTGTRPDRNQNQTGTRTGAGAGRNRNGRGTDRPKPVHGRGWGRGRPPLSLFLSAIPTGFLVTPVRTLLYSVGVFRSRIAFPFPFVFLHFSYTFLTSPPLVIRHLRSFCGMLVGFGRVGGIVYSDRPLTFVSVIQTKHETFNEIKRRYPDSL